MQSRDEISNPQDEISRVLILNLKRAGVQSSGISSTACISFPVLYHSLNDIVSGEEHTSIPHPTHNGNVCLHIMK